MTPWAARLERFSLTWVGAFAGAKLVGFVHALWDGGEHAFVLDPAVDPNRQRLGVGTRLMRTIIDEATAAGCTWLHVDYEPRLAPFYADTCGFTSTSAGLLRLTRT